MKKIVKNGIFLFLIVLVTNSLIQGTTAELQRRNLAIFTDYEADDSVAIALVLKHLKNNQIKDTKIIIGTLLSNQYRKKALAQELVKLSGYNPNCVHAGTGGIKEPFEEEGRNILAPEVLANFAQMDQGYLVSKDPALHQSPELQDHFLAMLEKADQNSVDVLLLTNPIDFVQAFEHRKDLFAKIKSIYMMGGWGKSWGNNVKPSFNWQLDIESVKRLMQLMDEAQSHSKNPQLILFSSHFFAREFNGYVNQTKFPEVIKAFDASKHPIVNHLRHMVKNWDDSMTVIKEYHTAQEREWRLAMVERIGKDNIGRQFTPADPATVIGYLYPEQFIKEMMPMKITIDKEIVTAEIDPSSNVFVVEKVDLEFFSNKLVELMKYKE